MNKTSRNRDKFGKYRVEGKSKISMDDFQVISAKKGVKPLHKVNGVNATVTINVKEWRLRLMSDSWVTAERLKVFFVLLDALRERSNKVFLTEREIAELANVSRSTVHRAMMFFVMKDILVRVDKESWMVNPEMAWKWRHREYAAGVMAYRELRRKQRLEAVQEKLPRIKKRGKLVRDMVVEDSVYESEDRGDEYQARAGS